MLVIDVFCKYLKVTITVDGEFSQLYDYATDGCHVVPIFVEWPEGECVWTEYDLHRCTCIHSLARYDDRNRS